MSAFSPGSWDGSASNNEVSSAKSRSQTIATWVIAIATVVGLTQPRQPGVLWGILAVAVLVLLFMAAQPTWNFFRRWAWWLGDRRRARRLYPQLQELVAEFSTFVDSNRTTFESVLSQEVLSHTPGAPIEELGLANQSIFHSFSTALSARLQEERPTPLSFRLALEDLHNLRQQYERSCVAPIFEQPGPKLRGALTELTDYSRSSLEQVRERYHSYLTDLTRFWKDIPSSMLPINVTKPYFPSPRPLP